MAGDTNIHTWGLEHGSKQKKDIILLPEAASESRLLSVPLKMSKQDKRETQTANSTVSPF